MEKENIISSIAKRGNGEIYLGVVGAVRTGKSTFIKRFIENLVVPNITDDFDKKKCLDEIPQSAEGKTIMTTQPKFVPSNGATIKVENFEMLSLLIVLDMLFLVQMGMKMKMEIQEWLKHHGFPMQFLL